jgi:hypothetical protein
MEAFPTNMGIWYRIFSVIGHGSKILSGNMNPKGTKGAQWSLLEKLSFIMKYLHLIT